MVENESLFVTYQAAKVPTRVVLTIVIHRLIGIDLRINEAYYSDMMKR